MSYDQAMKHSRNHRKDRFYQQCSGYFGGQHSEVKVSEDVFDINAERSIRKILEEEHTYPIYLAQDQKFGVYEIVPQNCMYGHKIEGRKELETFAEEYVFSQMSSI